jgi:hypothetical protein
MVPSARGYAAISAAPSPAQLESGILNRDLHHLLNTLTSKDGQDLYDRVITGFVDWHCSEPQPAFNHWGRGAPRCQTSGRTVRIVSERVNR